MLFFSVAQILFALLVRSALAMQTDNTTTQRCMEKVQMVEETKWEHKIKCHHRYGKRCFDTFITTYTAVQVSNT